MVSWRLVSRPVSRLSPAQVLGPGLYSGGTDPLFLASLGVGAQHVADDALGALRPGLVDPVVGRADNRPC